MQFAFKSNVVTLAIEAPVKAVDPVVANAASQAALEASNEAANIANVEANAKAATKRAKKQRQKAKKQQQQEAHQLQQQRQPDGQKKGVPVQQVPLPQPPPLQSFCSAVSMDKCSSTTSMSAPAVAQQALGDELATLAEAPVSSAAVSQCMPIEATTGTVPSCASSGLAVQAPQLQPETPDTVGHGAYSAHIQQTGLDSAESASDAPETQRPQASAEGYAPQGVNRVCTQELPFCDLKQNFDTACMPARGDQLPTCNYQHVPSLLCCPITKVRYCVAMSIDCVFRLRL